MDILYPATILAFIFSVAAWLIWKTYRLGMVHGGDKTATHLISGATWNLPDYVSEALVKKNLTIQKSRKRWLKARDIEEYLHIVSDLGVEIGLANFWNGEESERRLSAAPSGTAQVQMPRQHLQEIARLADYGFTLMIASDANSGFSRHVDRYDQKEAERTANWLESFERKVALVDETKEDRDFRFEWSFNRQTRIWDVYGGGEGSKYAK